jgi:hypothetical protein
MSLAQALMTASAAILFALALLHLVYTFWGPKLTPRDPALQEQMKQAPLVLTRETTMWKTWIGFNASHSLGGMLFGLIYGYLALCHPAFLFDSAFLLGLGLATLLAYAVLGKLYWFKVPFTGILLSLAAYVGALATGLAR